MCPRYGAPPPYRPIMRARPPRFIHSRTYALFFHGFPVVPGGDFWHNWAMPTRDEKNAAELTHAVLPPAYDDRAASEEIPSGEIGGPAGPEPTRFGDWERKGRCIDF
jgi:hypothetical protein